MNKFSIGTRVKFNDGVACAYVGKIGTVIEHRESVICGHVNVVKLDEPTRSSPHWPLNETLGAGDHCMDSVKTLKGAYTSTPHKTIQELADLAVGRVTSGELRLNVIQDIMDGYNLVWQSANHRFIESAIAV